METERLTQRREGGTAYTTYIGAGQERLTQRREGGTACTTYIGPRERNGLHWGTLEARGWLGLRSDLSSNTKSAVPHKNVQLELTRGWIEPASTTLQSGSCGASCLGCGFSANFCDRLLTVVHMVGLDYRAQPGLPAARARLPG